jgi:hypothetical protein
LTEFSDCFHGIKTQVKSICQSQVYIPLKSGNVCPRVLYCVGVFLFIDTINIHYCNIPRGRRVSCK